MRHFPRGASFAGLTTLLLLAPGARAQLDAIVFDGAIAVQDGQPAPGTGGGHFTGFSAVSVNGSGALAFVADVSGGTAAQGVFVRAGGTTTALAVAGQSAPGTGGSFSAFHGISLNDSGDFAFEALATGTFWPEGSGEGVFRGSGGGIAKVALGGEVAFAAVRYSRLGISEVALGNGGHVAFLSELDDCPACSIGIFRADGAGQVQPVVVDGAIFLSLGSLDVDGSGNVVFFGSRTTGDGIFRDATGTSAVAVQGEAAPGTGGSYGPQTVCYPQAELFGSVDVNDAGQVAFRADYSDGLPPPSGGNGLFLDTAGGDAAIAVRGGSAPGGGSFGCMSPLEGGVAINEAGAAAFWAAVGSGADEGIFVRSGGTTTPVARKGGSLPGAPCYVYAGFSPSTVQLDDAGRVAFAAQFGLAGDGDCDGIPDVLDKCLNDPRNAVADCDTDRDGYGNVCDGDFNQGGAVTAADYSMFFVPALGTGKPDPSGTDMNCSGDVTAADYSMFFVPQFYTGKPGPSGLSCAGTVPCE
jgi:hypothetical protein